MIELGIYRAEDGKDYHCQYALDDKIAEAIGPLPEPGQTGARGVAYEVKAESEQEARAKLAAKIGLGTWLRAKT